MFKNKTILYFSRESAVYFHYLLPILTKTGGMFVTESESLYRYVSSRFPLIACRLDHRRHLSRYRPGAVVLAGDERKIHPKYRLVQVFHGLADKRAVYDKRNFKVRESLPFRLSRFIERRLPARFHIFSLLSDDLWPPFRRLRLDRLIQDRYALLCLTGKHMEEKLRAAGVLSDHNWKKIGFPRLDVVTNRGLDRAAILAELGLDPARETILYAPTWHGVGRINLSSIPDLGRDVVAAIGDDVNFIFRPHPNVIANREFPEAVAGIIEHTRRRAHSVFPDPYRDAIPLLFVADLLITDFSSTAVDFLALDRPMIFLDHLGEKWSDPDLVEVWIRAAGEIARNRTELEEALARCFQHPESKSELRKKFRDYFFYTLDGKASERAAAAIIELARNS